MIGVLLREPDIRRTLDQIVAAEAAGVPSVWLTTVGAGRDALELFAAAAVLTSRIKLGTAVIPIPARHPVALVSQAQVVEALAPGRLMIGLGPSSTGSVESVLETEWSKPLSRLGEYVSLLKTLLETGKVDSSGTYYSAHVGIRAPVHVPVYCSALRAGAFRFCGATADGAITWVAPWAYVEPVGLPALRAGADAAGRPAPELIYHVPVCVSADREEALAAARAQLGSYANIPAWKAMFEDAGMSPTDGAGFFDSYLISGSESEVAAELRSFLGRGASQVIADPIIVGDKDASRAAAFRAIAAAN
jgi:F420-dependent oxidoreductase-like protein